MKQFSFNRKPSRAFPPVKTTRTGVVTPMRRLRVLYVLLFFSAWALAICFRLVLLQVFEHHEYVLRAARQQQRTFEVAPRRGILYDRNLHELAMTVLADSIYAVPSEMGTSKAQTAAALAKIVHTDPSDSFTTEKQILARLRDSKNFAWVARKQNEDVIARVKALGLKGIYFQKEFKRFYPDNDIAAQVLGYVGLDDNGLGGIEQKFDRQLHGTSGRMLTALDARRHVLGSEERDPQAGDNLVLTVDSNIQFMAEQALDHAMERVKPLNGTVVVQDPHTGQILALAIRPAFNPNDFRHATRDLLRDHAVSDVYEPGSTFKLVTYSAALEEKVTNPNQMIDCQGGKIVVAGRTVHDDHYNGILSTSQALWESSDVAAIKLALRMGPQTFYKYIHAYGFGQKSGLEVPGETRGLVKPPNRWQPTTIGSIPMGQEIGVTPVQLITMVSTIANGGMYLPPHLILKSTDLRKGNPQLKPATFHPGYDLPDPLPPGAHRVISTYTAAEMRKMMQGVVLYGTGKNAQLNGYTSAGKTGTAQKIDVRTHTYSKTKYIASFVGFAPVNNPAVSIAVIIDSPSVGSHFGSSVSAPVFNELAQQVLEYLGVPHDEPLKTAPELAKARKAVQVKEVDSEQVGDLNGLFAEVNDLPADDPLRAPEHDPKAAAPLAAGDNTLRAATAAPAATSDQSNADAKVGAPPGLSPAPSAPAKAPASPQPAGEPVTVDARRRVAVPSVVGQSVRAVIERAGAVGLGVQVLGDGIAREQAPAPGTMVPVGAEIVVRFKR